METSDSNPEGGRNITNECSFSFEHYERILDLLQSKSYSVYTCEGFICAEKVKRPFIVLRHDIEYYPEKALEFARIEKSRGVRSSYFFRVHAKEYNLFSYRTYKSLRSISELGHEIGLHSENLDFAHVTNESPDMIVRKEKSVLELILGKAIKGVSPHRDLTWMNNLDFWKDHRPADFDFDYCCYEDRFFRGSIYVSDSLGKWKSYESMEGEPKGIGCICDVIRTERDIYALIHPRTWFHEAYFLEC